MWNLIRAAAAVLSLAGIIYLWTRFRKFYFVRKLSEEKRGIGVLLSLLPIAALIVCGLFDAVNTVIAGLHLAIFWMACDALGFAFRRLHRQQRIYWQGTTAILVTAIYLGTGLYLDYHVWETDYSIETDKELGVRSFRIVQISDSHLGTTFGGEGFAKHLERIQETKPDLVVLTGDFVDDDSTREDMIRSCRALGEMDTAYGVYYVFGNHDEGYFHYRDFTGQEMVEELEKNGVRVLEDETVRITDRICLTGRKDRSDPGRLSAAQLMENADPSCYNILLDHQPHDFDNEAEAGFDLVLCGHTHGGQMFPIGITGELSGANDKTYGMEKRGDTVFIVNSGISDWAIKFKTATRSEYGVIDLQKK